MKKNIFFVTLLCALVITFHTHTYGQQCDSPPLCTQLTFTPSPSQLSMPEFDLDCNNNFIEANLGIPPASNESYNWYNSDGVNVASNTETLTNPSPGIYTLEITYNLPGVMESVCCFQQVIVNDWGVDVDMEVRRQGETIPTTEVCLGENVALVAMPNTFTPPYTWTLPDGTTTTSNDAATIFTTSSSGTNSFSLQVQDSNGCVGFASTSITVQEPPNLTPTATPNSLCTGDAITVNGGLMPASGLTYNFIWNTGETTSEFFPTPSQNTDYTVTVTDSNGCISVDSVSVQVNPIPDSNITTLSNDFNICPGESITLLATDGNDTYEWNGNMGDSILTVNPEITTEYELVTTLNGCTSMNSQVVTVNTRPEFQDSYNDVTVTCNNMPFSVTPLLHTGGISPFVYSWNIGEAQADGSVTVSVPGTYILTITDDNGCTDTASFIANFNTDKPEVQIPTTNNSTLTCQNPNAILTVIATPEGMGNTINQNSYTWQRINSDGSIAEFFPNEDNTLSISIAGMYNVIAMQSNGCTEISGNIDIEDGGLPLVQIISNTDVLNCDVDSILLDVQVTNGSGSDITYDWSNGSTQSSIMVGAPNMYSVDVTVGDCEPIMVSTNVTQYKRFPNVMDAAIDECVPAGGSVTFDVSTDDVTSEDTDSVSIRYFDENNQEVTFPYSTPEATTNLRAVVELLNSGCIRESMVTLNAVQFDAPQISVGDTPISDFCNNQAITISMTPSSYTYDWVGLNDEQLIQGIDGNCFALNLSEINTNTLQLNYSLGANCINNTSVEFNGTPSATDAKVFQFADTDVLFCNRNDFSSYQWGRESKATLCPEPDTMGIGIFQDYVIPIGIQDTLGYYYWVIVTDDAGCTNKIYLEGNGTSPFGKFVQDPNIEYGDLALQISPNPNKGTFELTITGDETRNLDVHVYDALGRMVHHQNAFKEYGIRTYYVAVPNPTQGVYFVRVTGNDGILLTEKIIVK